MANELDFLESFSERAFGDVLKKVWTEVGPGNSFETGGRFGKPYYRHRGFSSLYQDNGGSTVAGGSGVSAHVSMGAAVRCFIENGDFKNQAIFTIIGINDDPASIGTELRYSSDARLYVVCQGMIVGFSDISKSLFLDVWYFIEWEVVFHESSDTNITPHTIDTKIWVDGEKVCDVSSVIIASKRPHLNFSWLGFSPVGSLDYCDMYFRIGSAFGIGGRVIALHPNGDGAYKEFPTPASGDHYVKVDETLLDTSDFIETTIEPKRDTFTLEDIDTSIIDGGTTIRMSQFEYYAEGGGDDKFPHHLIRLGGGDINGTVKGVSGKYNRLVFDQDPSGSGNYSVSAFNSTEGGVKVKEL